MFTGIKAISHTIALMGLLNLDLKRISVIVLFAYLSCLSVQASIEVVDLGDEQLEQRYQQLTRELRCLVCQNQNLAESDASLAADLRLLLQEQLRSGKTNEQIIQYLVARYGEFVHYKPSFSGNHLLVWLAPVAFLLLGVALWIILSIKRDRSAPMPE